MGFVNEFKQFAIKGNVADMAVGIIIGAAFGKIVSSLVADVIMPPLGLVIGGVNFTGLKVTLKEATETAAAVTLNYGVFLQTVIDFIIIAFALFLVVRGMNKLRLNQPAPSAPPAQETLLREIRDILKSKNT